MSINIKKETDLNNIDINLIEVNQSIDIQSNNNDNSKIQPKRFQTLMRKAVNNYPIFYEIIESIQKIKFEEFEDDFNEYLDSKEKNKINDDEKVVIVIENLLEIIENKGLGIGVENELTTLLYNNNYWVEVNSNLVKTFLIEVAVKSGLKIWTSRKKRFSDSLYSQFLLTAGLPEIENKKDEIKINLLNGTFLIKNGNNGILMNTDKEDYFKYQLAFNYDPEAKAPMFQKILDEVLPDLDSQKVLMEYCGYILTKGIKLERILILQGSGANGKSVFFEILTALLGNSNVSYFPMDKICDELGYYRAKLSSKLLNYASEFGGKINPHTFKSITSGEPIDARLPYKDPITIDNYCKFIFNANKLPEVEHTDAFFRRPLIINFSKKIEVSQRDINLSKKIINAELSGIFNLILDGMERLITQGDFSEADLISNELLKYRSENNSVSLFLGEENWIRSNSEKTRLNDLFKSYQQYCSESGQRPFARPNFSKRLKEMGITVEPGTNNYTVVWVEKDISNEEKNPFTTFINIDNNIVSEILDNNK